MTTLQGTRDEFLTNYAKDYLGAKVKSDNIISMSGAVREVEVGSESFEYSVYAKENLYRFQSEVAPTDKTRFVELRSTKTAGLLRNDFRLGATYVPRDIKNAAGGESQVQQQRTNTASWYNLLNYEVALAAVFNSGTKTSAAANKWDVAAGDPVKDFRTMFKAVRDNSAGLLADSAILSYAEYQALVTNANFSNFVKGSSNSSMMTLEEVQAALSNINGGNVNLSIASSVYNAAQQNTTATYTAAEAFTASTVYVYRRGEDGNDEDISAVSQFAMSDQEGIYTSGDPDNDNARDMKVVTHKLSRVPLLTADDSLYRMTAVI